MSSAPAKLRVVVADDSPIVRTMVRHALESDGGIEVVAEAADGADALRQVERTTPDLLVLDLDMPTVSGFDVIARLMADRPLPILVLTAQSRHGGHDKSKRALDLGALEVMAKSSAWDEQTMRQLCAPVHRRAHAHVPGRGAPPVPPKS